MEVDLTYFQQFHIQAIFLFDNDEVIQFYDQISLFFDGQCPFWGNSMSVWTDHSKNLACQKLPSLIEGMILYLLG